VLKLNEDFEVTELTAKLGGIIFRKAELENDFEKVYLKFFEKIVEIQIKESEELLEVLGNVGG